MSIADDDRSLLFATLAARSGLISTDDLDQALRQWASDRSRFIAEILTELGSLDPRTKEAAEQLMRVHLSQYGGDPSKSLKALTTLGEDGDQVDEAPESSLESGKDYSLLVDPNALTMDPNDTLPPGDVQQGSPEHPSESPASPRFRLLHLHAKGGLGEVHVAHDKELDREVALKEIQKRFADDPGSRSRFLIEAKITGNLEHPGIVPVYGLGRHGDGRPYYAMRFIRGESLREAIERFHHGEGRPRSTSDRALRLRKLIVRFLAVCDAVDYAHSRGVIHRDLKPSNILLGPHGETLVVDWGLAKPLGEIGPAEAGEVARGGSPEGQELDATVAIGPQPKRLSAEQSGSTEQTRPGSAVGTPHYMAPEQAVGDPDRIGPRSDVYSLGATLYTLLTGHPPVEGENPKSILERVEAGELVPARSRDRSLDPALEAICSMAMALDPVDRYPSARALADDLERWLADEPVLARRDPGLVRLGRWSRRHQTWVAGVLAALIVSVLSIGFVTKARLDREVALGVARLSDRDARNAREAERLQRYYALFDRLRQRSSDPRPGWTWQAREELALAARLRPVQDIEGATSLRTIAAGTLATFDYREAPDLLPGINPSCLAFSPDGRTLALGEFKAQAFLVCSVALVDWAEGKVIRRFTYPPSMRYQIEGERQDGARHIAFDPSGRWLAVGTRSGRIFVWDLHRDQPRYRFWAAHDDEVLSLAFGAGGETPTLYSCGSRDHLRRWVLDPSGRAPNAPAAEFGDAAEVHRLAVSHSGDLAYVIGNRLYLLDPETLEPILEGPEVGSDRLVWSPDGRMLAAGGEGAITLVSADGLQVVRRLTDPDLSAAHRHALSGLDFHPSGAMLASASSHDSDRRIKFWDSSTGKMVGSIHNADGTGYGVIDVAFTTEGDRLVMTGKDRASVIELSDHPAYRTLGLDIEGVEELAFVPDGTSLVRLGRSAEALRIGVWEVEEGRWLSGVEAPAGGSALVQEAALAVAPQGNRLAFSGAGAQLLFWTIGSDEAPEVIEASAPASLQFDKDGRQLWGRLDEGRELSRWDVDRLDRTLEWVDRGAEIVRGMRTLTSLTVSEPWIVAGGRDGFTRLLRIENEIEDGAPVLVHQWDHNDGPVTALALWPGANLVAAGTLGGSIQLIPLPNGVPSARIEDAHPGGITRLVISPDGRSLASGGFDRAIRLWRFDGQNLFPVATLGIATGTILDLDFSDDSQSLAVAIEGELAIRLWQLDRLGAHWDELGIGLDR